MQKHIRTNLAYLRLVRGKLGQSTIAKATGIGQKTISALETGASQGIEFGTLAKLCAYLKCTPGDLLVLEDEPETKPPSPSALKKADKLIAKGLKAALSAPEQSAAEVWTEFDKVCQKLQKNTGNTPAQNKRHKHMTRA